MGDGMGFYFFEAGDGVAAGIKTKRREIVSDGGGGPGKNCTAHTLSLAPLTRRHVYTHIYIYIYMYDYTRVVVVQTVRGNKTRKKNARTEENRVGLNG
jgi:hypothetical protein